MNIGLGLAVTLAIALPLVAVAAPIVELVFEQALTFIASATVILVATALTALVDLRIAGLSDGLNLGLGIGILAQAFMFVVAWMRWAR